MPQQYFQSNSDDPFEEIMDQRMPAIYQMLLPFIMEAYNIHAGVSHMDNAQLRTLADQIAQQSGVLNNMPQGYTRESVRDLIISLLLSMDEGVMADDLQDADAVEALSPLPLALGLGLGGFPYPLLFTPFYFSPFRPRPRRRRRF